MCGDEENCTKESLIAEWKLTESYTNMEPVSSTEEIVEQITGMCGFLEKDHQSLMLVIEAYSINVQFKLWMDDRILARYKEFEPSSE